MQKLKEAAQQEINNSRAELIRVKSEYKRFKEEDQLNQRQMSQLEMELERINQENHNRLEQMQQYDEQIHNLEADMEKVMAENASLHGEVEKLTKIQHQLETPVASNLFAAFVAFVDQQNQQNQYSTSPTISKPQFPFPKSGMPERTMPVILICCLVSSLSSTAKSKPYLQRGQSFSGISRNLFNNLKFDIPIFYQHNLGDLPSILLKANITFTFD